MEKNQKKLIFFMPSMEGGGVEKNLILIANYISNKNVTVNLISYDTKFKKKFNNKINFITPKFLNSNRSKYFKYFFCLLILAKELLKQEYLVFSFQANIYSIILCKIFKTRVIVRSNSSPSGWNKNLLKNYVFNFFLKKSDVIIVNSLSFKKELDRKFNTRSIVILNPLNKNEIIKKSKEKIKFGFFKKNSLNLINIARFTDQKDHFLLLNAVNKLKDKLNIKLLIMGYGANKNKIQKFIKLNKLQNIISLINFQKNPYPYLRKSDVFILTSRYEGLPNVLLEALTLKKFIISTNCPTGPKEILKNGKYGDLIRINNVSDLMKKITNYKNQKKVCDKKAYKGYLSLNKYDYDQNCRKYLSIVNKFI
jgi:glycosyltransferase involved in cell wall biosynthesis